MQFGRLRGLVDSALTHRSLPVHEYCKISSCTEFMNNTWRVREWFLNIKWSYSWNVHEQFKAQSSWTVREMMLEHEMILFIKIFMSSSWQRVHEQFVYIVQCTEFMNTSWTGYGPIRETYSTTLFPISAWAYLKGVSSLTSLLCLWRSLPPVQKWP